jgi:hypothetical protein
VRELVRQRHLPQHARACAGALDHAQAAVGRVVVAEHALLEQRAGEGAQVLVRRDQAEQLVDGLVGPAPGERVLLVEVGQPFLPRRGGAHRHRLRELLEAQVAQRLDPVSDHGHRCGGLLRGRFVLPACQQGDAEKRDEQHGHDGERSPHP